MNKHDDGCTFFLCILFQFSLHSHHNFFLLNICGERDRDKRSTGPCGPDPHRFQRTTGDKATVSYPKITKTDIEILLTFKEPWRDTGMHQRLLERDKGVGIIATCPQDQIHDRPACGRTESRPQSDKMTRLLHRDGIVAASDRRP